MKFQSLFCVVVCLLALPSSIDAAWTKPVGETQIVHSLFFYQTDTFYNPAGGRQATERFRGVDYNPFFEYGWKERVTLGASPHFQLSRLDKASGGADQQIGLGDVELFARIELWQDDKNVLSIQPLIKLPGLYDEDETPALGNGQVDVELLLQWGDKFQLLGREHYSTTEIGYRKRFDGISDEYRFINKLNISLHEKWDITTEMKATISKNRETVFDVANIARSVGYSLYRGQVSLRRMLDEKRAIQLGVFRHFAGENTGAGGGVMLAFWQKW